MHVLVVEDDPKLAAFVRNALTAQGFAVDGAADGEVALERASTERFDTIVLDIMLPRRDGLSVVRLLRDRRITTPVLLLSARGEVHERVEGLNAGADDYLPKPFVLAELVARVNALARRSGENPAVALTVADLRLSSVTREVFRGDDPITLAPREFRLLEHLARRPGRVFSRMELLEAVWEYHFDPGTNLVDVCVRRLREKVDHGREPKLIVTVRGIGYTLKVPG